ncbi:formylglycine-generating enzyme family protein [Thermomonas sp.]|uniref:formylglycine-generating enzyme family protein n=1 Tax=Thermomonas sp. TaxID=1971895 RepID=UPI0024895487|nr:formylglycine-generating enzyme family protein [Thermomonas sp.]MDI1252890.1 formylglycine-generating enzyme family protein [Thermomonas sp.]
MFRLPALAETDGDRDLRAGWTAIVIVLLLAACEPEKKPAPAPAKLPSVAAVPSVRAGSVSISGDDALAQVLTWSLPAVVIEKDGVGAARRRLKHALEAGDLFETADSAIPLLLALQQMQPDDPALAKQVAQTRMALIMQGDAALIDGDADLDALRMAQRRAAVLRKLWPADTDVLAYLARVDRSERAWDHNAQGDALLAAGQLGENGGGALAAYRVALSLRPGQPRASQGMVAVETGLIGRAEAAALQGDFNQAQQQLAYAAKVRSDPGTIPAALRRINAIRGNRLRRLRDQGLIALGDADGLRIARERLAEMLRIADPSDPASVELRQRIDLVGHYGLFRPGQVFTDELRHGGRGPELVVIPHGTFRMGAPEDEEDAKPAEQPQHEVRLERGFALGRNEITVGEFGRFVTATGYTPRATQRGHSMAYDARSGNFVRGSGIDWRSTYDGKPAAAGMPVVHVTARDAEAYAEWLSTETRAHYRLPSEAEFEYALRAGSQTRYPWGDGGPPPGSENVTGGLDRSPQRRTWSNAFVGYDDGWWGPAPAGSMAANAYGLHDMAGNVSEWVADCWHQGYRRAPANGAAWVNPGCRNRMYRGGSWASAPAQVRSAWRVSGGMDATNARVGFRLVRQI